MGLFGKSKDEKLEEQIREIESSDPKKAIELCDERIKIWKGGYEFELAEIYLDKTELLFSLDQYVESLKCWEEGNTIDNIVGVTMPIILKAKLLHKLERYAEALHCFNSYEEENGFIIPFRLRLDIELVGLKTMCMVESGKSKEEVLVYLHNQSDKIWHRHVNSNTIENHLQNGITSYRYNEHSFLNESDAHDDQNLIAEIIVLVNELKFKQEVVRTNDVSQNNISKKGGALPKGFEAKDEPLKYSRGTLPKGF